MITTNLNPPVGSLDANLGELRSRVALVRRNLAVATEAYRRAAAKRDSGQAIFLLRERSLLLRELLETQCELLVAMRQQNSEIGEPQ